MQFDAQTVDWRHFLVRCHVDARHFLLCMRIFRWTVRKHHLYGAIFHHQIPVFIQPHGCGCFLSVRGSLLPGDSTTCVIFKEDQKRFSTDCLRDKNGNKSSYGNKTLKGYDA